MTTNDNTKEHGFLPDFCSVGAVVSIIISAQLLAMVLALYVSDSLDQLVESFSRASWFILWTALITALFLCLFRSLWRRLPPLAAGLLAWAMIVLVALAISVAAAHLLSPLWPQLAGLAFHVKSAGITAIVGALLLRYLYMQHRWRTQVEAETEARLQAMQARIRPHFLFNSMNTLAELTRSDPEKAEQVVEDLSDLYRACMTELGRGNTLGDELELVEGYLRIERLRLGERLQVEWRMDDLPRDICLPALILQPLVENAVYHGIEPAEGPGRLVIEGDSKEGMVHLGIYNTLPDATRRSLRPGNQLALDNIRARLVAFFGERARLDTSESRDEYRVDLRFPGQS